MTAGSEQIDLLVVDDDAEFRSTVVRRFVRRGYRVREASNAVEAQQQAVERQFDVALLDLVMPGMSGIELLDQLKQLQPECEAILLTGQGSIETAVEAMRKGAFDYLTKPFPLGELEMRVEKAYDRRLLKKENVQLKTWIERTRPQFDILGDSTAMKEVFRLIERAGPTDKAILIQGESGTGKELVARALHRSSPRADKPLVVVNCAALTETLLESELFGHEKGSFTGAIQTKLGLFEVADGGTLMIDEIGEMPGSLQAKLLRVLEDGSLRRVGSTKEIRVNVRLLAATNRNLADEVRAGRFREDLYYRINVMSLELPPLRQRTGDISLLVRHFLGTGWQIDPAAMKAIEAFSWPGNVRQLINAIERARIMANGNRITLQDLPACVTNAKTSASDTSRPDSDRLDAIEKAHVIEVLQRERGNKARAARALGVNRRSLYRLLEKHSIGDRPGDSLAALDGTKATPA